jgi:putative nucleotidyltransferase with HDIG domain
VPWDALDAELSWVRAMRDCPQDPIHHAEGNVWIHTRMVLEALVALPRWRALPTRERELVFAACLLHDIAKPWTTQVHDDGRVTARGHSAAGAIAARRVLWELDVDPADREAICGLVRLHQLPFFCVEDATPERLAVMASLRARCDHLALVNEADGRGRVCDDPQRIADNVALFEVLCEEVGCWTGPFDFASPSARVRFARKGSSRFEQPPAYHRCEVVVMSGLPGAGKDTWIANHLPDWPVVSLDALRAELGVEPTEPQGPVAAEGRERARQHLRASRSFVWNATNVSRQHRDRVVDLALDYGARVRIVYVEAPRKRLYAQNRSRDAVVPDVVIDRLQRRWEVPTLAEAHQVDWVW